MSKILKALDEIAKIAPEKNTTLVAEIGRLQFLNKRKIEIILCILVMVVIVITVGIVVKKRAKLKGEEIRRGELVVELENKDLEITKKNRNALDFYRQKQYYAMVGILEEIYKREYHQESAINLAIGYKELKEWNKAIEILQVVMDKDPDAAIAWNNRGVVYLNNGELLLAEADFRKAMTLDVKYFDAYLNLAVALEKQHRWKESLSFYQKYQKQLLQESDLSKRLEERIKRIMALTYIEDKDVLEKKVAGD
ncbi:MAG: tetratricopeptide repeat protein [Oligoflexia bacterium]|nr:tetratricopeptide repeat protein [Oligoflexia bacterium]MBF0367201.1 tetratricopeptide repeat protein [Oligoflexia bacterium]